MLRQWFRAVALLTAVLISGGTDARQGPQRRELSYEQYVKNISANTTEVVLNVSTKNVAARNATAP
jgi:hypothetical protein